MKYFNLMLKTLEELSEIPQHTFFDEMFHFRYMAIDQLDSDVRAVTLDFSNASVWSF